MAVLSKTNDFSTSAERIRAFKECLLASPLGREMDGQSLITGIQILYLKFNFLLEDPEKYPSKVIIKEEMAQAVREYFKSDMYCSASNS